MKLVWIVLLIGVSVMAKPDETKRSIKTSTGYLIVLRQGDDVFKELEKFAQDKNIPSATFFGMGFVNAKLGYFNFKTKEYEPKEFKGVELASMNGSIAWQDGKPSLHIHGLLTEKDFKAYGGHLLAAEVGTGSVEITMLVNDQKLERKMEQPLGANVLNLNNPSPHSP
jgi:predicted DNA-binding protein with PD1-like motif